MSEQAEVLTAFRRADGEIRVSISHYRGHDLVDLRAFWQPDGEDELKPTKKGVSFHGEQLPELIGALTKAAVKLGVEV